MKKTIPLIAVAVLLSVNAFAGGKGKIVFSKSPIDAATGESLPPVTFEVGDKIYCRVYLPKPLSSYKNFLDKPTTNYGVRVVLNEKQYCFVNAYSFSSEQEAKVLNFEFILNQDENGKIYEPAFTEALNNLPNGSYTLKIDLPTAGCSETKNLAVGEFNLIKTANSKLNFANSFNKIESKMSNPALEAKIMKSLNDDKLTNSATKGKTYLKLKLVSEDWIIVRNEATGVIIGRTIDVAISYKDEKGNCGIDLDAFREDYTGAGYQEKPYYVRRAFLEQEHPDIKIGPADCE